MSIGSLIRPLAKADASCGAKAFGLARLIAAGLRVPDGFVVDASVFRTLIGHAGGDADGREAGLAIGDALDDVGHTLAAAEDRIDHGELPAALEREVRERADQLGRLAVRSSASIEDGALGSAAGVFASVTDVAPADVWDAIRAVWRSALTPLAVNYARRRSAKAIAIAVIVQRFVPGARITIYTRAPFDPAAAGDAMLLQHAQPAGPARELERIARSEASRRADTALALAAETAIGATTGADVELIVPAADIEANRAPWIVQARPIVVPAARHRRAPPPIVIAPLRDGRTWRWDIAHNPDPLSPAQTGLVEHVERAAAAPYMLRVCSGYLYAAPREPTVPPPAAPAERAELAARIAAIEARFTLTSDAAPPPNIEDAVAQYVAFMRIWSYELSPLVAAARRRLLDRLARDGHAPERIPALAAELIGPRRVVRDRVMSPAWDVAVPTFAEQTTAAVREVTLPPRLPDPPPALITEVELARAAADAAERDDIWFARAQWLVRRALLACSEAHQLRGDDIFWLPFDQVLTLRTYDADDVHRLASAARAAHARAAEWDMPLVVDGSAPVDRESSSPLAASHGSHVLHGVGVGSRAIGRVVRFAELRAAVPVGRGDIVVTRAITPALAMIVDGCAALVSETGGLLDHGAALARELGIPCVVGCAGAWSALADGMTITVDGDAGTVQLS